MPKISIITTTYNRSHLVLRAIKSVIAQTIKDWELWIIDDGSKDDTKEVITNFLSEYETQNTGEKLPIYYHYQENAGQVVAVNNIIDKSIGAFENTFITFLDSDDEYLPNHLELRLNFVEKNPSVDIVHGGIEIIGNPFLPDKYDISKTIHIKDCIIGGTFFGKNPIIKHLKFRELAYAYDFDLIERAINTGLNVAKVDFPTYRYYRDSPDSICSNLKME